MSFGRVYFHSDIVFILHKFQDSYRCNRFSCNLITQNEIRVGKWKLTIITERMAQEEEAEMNKSSYITTQRKSILLTIHWTLNDSSLVFGSSTNLFSTNTQRQYKHAASRNIFPSYGKQNDHFTMLLHLYRGWMQWRLFRLASNSYFSSTM